MAISPSEFHGILVVDKPTGMTSHDVVGQIRKIYQTKRVGHTGTLDPDASGVLVLCLGQATRLAEYLSAAHKHYVTEVVLGVETDTQDASGQTTATCDASHLTQADVEGVLPRFRGTIQQIPPMVSALHHQGKRLYELARAGVTVERAARQIQIEYLEMTEFIAGEHPAVQLEVTCSTGTYIRTLAADIGAALGVGGMMRRLRRTWVGTSEASAFRLLEAHTLESLQDRKAAGTLRETLLPILMALRDWPQIQLDAAQSTRIRNGQAVLKEAPGADYASWPDPESAQAVAILNEAGTFFAVGRIAEEKLTPVKVIAP